MLDAEQLMRKITKGGNITVVIGRRGSGKTGIGFKTLEIARGEDRPVYAVGFPEEARKLLPGYIEIVKSIKDVPNSAFAFLDEAVLQFNARNWQKSDDALTEVIDIARHKDLSIVFLSINSAMIDPNILRAIDTLIMKEPSLLQQYMERPFMKKFLNKVHAAYKDIPPENRVQFAYVFDDQLGEGLVQTSLPTFWSDELSKSYKDYSGASEPEQKGIKVVGRSEMPIGESPICFKCKNFVFTEEEAWCPLGHDVGVFECEDFSQQIKPKVWKWQKQSKKKNKAPWVKNPPEGLEQCLSCTNGLDETENGYGCEVHGNVKFIQGICETRMVANPRANPAQASKRVEKAVVLLSKFKKPVYTPQGPKLLWKDWIEFVESGEGGRVFNLSRKGTVMDAYTTKSSGGEIWTIKVHYQQVPGDRDSSFPIHCSGPSFMFSEAPKHCKHTKDFVTLVLEFASRHGVGGDMRMVRGQREREEYEEEAPEIDPDTPPGDGPGQRQGEQGQEGDDGEEGEPGEGEGEPGEGEGEPGDGEGEGEGEGEPGEGDPGDGEPGEGEGDGEGEGEGEPGDGEPGDEGEPQPGEGEEPGQGDGQGDYVFEIGDRVKLPDGRTGVVVGATKPVKGKPQLLDIDIEGGA